MNSLILCEGKTDCVLLQYYLEKVHLWRYDKGRHGIKLEPDCWSVCLAKNGHTLNIAETKGCSRLVEGLITAIVGSENAAPERPEEFWDKIIIFTDNDEENTCENMINDINGRLSETSASFEKIIQKGIWKVQLHYQ